MDSYLQLWTWPKAYASADKVCSSGHLKGTGSELLGIAPALQKWLEDVVQPVGICRSEVISALALMRAAEQLQLVQRQVGWPKARSKLTAPQPNTSCKPLYAMLALSVSGSVVLVMALLNFIQRC